MMLGKMVQVRRAVVNFPSLTANLTKAQTEYGGPACSSRVKDRDCLNSR
jgi:hypothetical protein